MPVALRELRHGEERLFLELHAQSIRGLAAAHYSPEVIDAWCVAPTEENLAKFIANPDRELRLFAELDGKVAGLAALVREVSGEDVKAATVNRLRRSSARVLFSGPLVGHATSPSRNHSEKCVGDVETQPAGTWVASNPSGV